MLQLLNYVFDGFYRVGGLLKSVTGCKQFTERLIFINFQSNAEQPAFTISTCGCQLDISTLIDIEEDGFTTAFKAITIGQDFTMA